MSNNPLVSIIIPCWNAENYVAEAIESALTQTYQNVEVIVIDDGSTDGSLDIIKSFGDRILWETGPNRGACAARNRGIELAKGELVQFVDADDILLKHKLDRQLQFLVKYDVDCVTCDRINYIEESGRQKSLNFNVKDRFQFEWIIQEELLGTASPLHKKRNLEEVNGFDEDLPCAQEYDLHIRLSLAEVRFKHISELLWIARELPCSVSSDAIKVTIQQPKIFYRARSIAVEKYKGTELDLILKSIAEACVRNARRCFQFHENSLAEDFINLAAKFHKDRGLGYYCYNPIILLIAKLAGVAFAEKMVALRRVFLHYYVSSKKQ